MDAPAWNRFYLLCKGQETPVGYIDAHYFSSALTTSFAHVVYIDHGVVKKAIEKHRLTPDHLTIISEALSSGEIRADPKRSQHVTLFFESSAPFRAYFKIGIKKCRQNPTVRVTTFFKIRYSEFKRLRKRAELLRPQIKTGTEVPVKNTR